MDSHMTLTTQANAVLKDMRDAHVPLLSWQGREAQRIEECGARGPVLAHARARAHRHTAQPDRWSRCACARCGCAEYTWKDFMVAPVPVYVV